ncbi:MAG: efflux RND transporter periplasmic adaptor subunit [Planctomycetia bacterium]|nr:efflux RND transporter periplasmic adaptor subunit [Planctomycetia bacterium]
MLAKSKSLALVAVCLAVGIGAGYYARGRIVAGSAAKAAPQPATVAASSAPKEEARLLAGHPDTVYMPEEIVDRLGVRIAKVEKVPNSHPLKLPGSLMLDSNRLARIHSRFDGHIMSLGMHRGPDGKPDRPLQFGDEVEKDQTLAVIWSKEIGQKKSELLDSYSQFNLSKATLDRLKTLRPGEVSEHVLRDAQRAYEGALISVQNGERTLRSWQLSEAEVAAIRREAERLHGEGAAQQSASDLREGWAELQVRAPFQGVILEKNITIGEIVDASLDLFKIGDIRRLMVVANVYEEDLPGIIALPPEMRKWRIALTAEPEAAPLTGTFELAGKIIDPVQHTAQLVGWVDNPNGKYMAGQFISALVELLPRQGEIIVPAVAVIDSGEGGVLYVVGGEASNEFSRKLVAVSYRGRSFVHLRTQLTDDERQRGFTVLQPGQRVVSSGIVILESTWKELGLANPSNDTGLAQQNSSGP